jgi:DNA-binding GntR family transcriptional regulator
MKPIIRQSAPLRIQVRELLRTEIVEMRLAPGARLVERELCEMMGVSRAVIREVLRELEADGLVRIIPNKGPVVIGLMEPDAARGLYDVRAILEALAGRNFVLHATSAERAALREAFRAIEHATPAEGDGDFRKILQAKSRFYGVLLAGAHNETLVSTLRSLHDRITALRALTISTPSRGRSSLEEIRRIVVAIEANDAEAAWEACFLHVQSAAKIALLVLGEGESALTAMLGQAPAAAKSPRWVANDKAPSPMAEAAAEGRKAASGTGRA